MSTVDGLLDEIDQLHTEVMEALVQSDAPRVELLVARQSERLASVDKSQIRAEHRERLMALTSKVEQQQLLIAQASAVAGNFLKRFYQDSSYSRRG